MSSPLVVPNKWEGEAEEAAVEVEQAVGSGRLGRDSEALRDPIELETNAEEVNIEEEENSVETAPPKIAPDSVQPLAKQMADPRINHSP